MSLCLDFTLAVADNKIQSLMNKVQKKVWKFLAA